MEPHRFETLFENRSLAEISLSKRGQKAGQWRKLCDVELIHFYSPPNWPITIMIESMRFRMAGHVAKCVRNIIDNVGMEQAIKET
jgi:hypothetical protein